VNTFTTDKLNELLSLPSETEWLEFKEAKNTFNFDDLGRYFSALSNEANLNRKECGWLVFGITDKHRRIVGSAYRSKQTDLESLKREIADQTTNRLSFEAIHELNLPEGRVLLFRIPSAPAGIPVAWKGHYYGRDGGSLVALNISEIERIRSRGVIADWSAQIVPSATMGDLEPKALELARNRYADKHPDRRQELAQWDDATFLNKAKLTIQGRITNAAILLLGREESSHFLSPSLAILTWILKNSDGTEQDYQHFGPPFMRNTDALFAKIRITKYRYLSNSTLFPVEVTQYEPWVIREALHNCIAHQDYSMRGRITVVEEAESLLFSNVGGFIPGTVEDAIRQDAPPEQYRNPFLAAAMVNLNMIDTIGSGIRKMYLLQRERFFPLPDFDLSDPHRVRVRVYGKILDENYTRTLINTMDLDLWDVIALDKVQKGRDLSKDEVRVLRSKNLVEGRLPNLFVSAQVAAATGDKAAYIRNRAFDKEHYKELVVGFLAQYGTATRTELDHLLLDKISDALSTAQKKNKVRNLLHEMAVKGTIHSLRKGSRSVWALDEKTFHVR